MKDSHIPKRLQEIIEDFALCEGQEKLMYLLDFAEELPDLPAWLQEKHDEMGQVHECMSPVFIFATLEEEGTLRYYFDIPREAPTVRGFGSVLYQGLDGLMPDEVLAVPQDFYLAMKMQEVMTGQRLNGISAILGYMKKLAREKI